MVALSDIKLNNESLSASGSGLTAALVGATNGIGLSTLHALLKHTNTPTVYIVGRDLSRLNSLVAGAQPLNPSATLIPIAANDLTLVRDAQKAAEEIASKESKLDLLILSPGYLSFNSRPDFSPEGLDRITSIRFHARMRILITLLSLLRAAPSPRVISIFAAGKETPIKFNDLAMTQPGTYSALYAAGSASTMTTLFFEELSRQKGNEKIVFEHIFPGLVSDTGLKIQNTHFLISFLFKWLAKPVLWLVGYKSAEVGERILFAATNGRFRRLAPGTSNSAKGTLIQEGSDGTQGSGVYAVLQDSSVAKNGGNADLRKMRDLGGARKVWEHTLAEFERVQAM